MPLLTKLVLPLSGRTQSISHQRRRQHFISHMIECFVWRAAAPILLTAYMRRADVIIGTNIMYKVEWTSKPLICIHGQH